MNMKIEHTFGWIIDNKSRSSFTISWGSLANLRNVVDDLTTTHSGMPSLTAVHVLATVANGPSCIRS
jgi:hypothetical protein